MHLIYASIAVIVLAILIYYVYESSVRKYEIKHEVNSVSIESDNPKDALSYLAILENSYVITKSPNRREIPLLKYKLATVEQMINSDSKFEYYIRINKIKDISELVVNKKVGKSKPYVVAFSKLTKNTEELTDMFQLNEAVTYKFLVK